MIPQDCIVQTTKGWYLLKKDGTFIGLFKAKPLSKGFFGYAPISKEGMVQLVDIRIHDVRSLKGMMLHISSVSFMYDVDQRREQGSVEFDTPIKRVFMLI